MVIYRDFPNGQFLNLHFGTALYYDYMSQARCNFFGGVCIWWRSVFQHSQIRLFVSRHVQLYLVWYMMILRLTLRIGRKNIAGNHTLAIKYGRFELKGNPLTNLTTVRFYLFYSSLILYASWIKVADANCRVWIWQCPKPCRLSWNKPLHWLATHIPALPCCKPVFFWNVPFPFTASSISMYFQDIPMWCEKSVAFLRDHPFGIPRCSVTNHLHTSKLTYLTVRTSQECVLGVFFHWFGRDSQEEV